MHCHDRNTFKILFIPCLLSSFSFIFFATPSSAFGEEFGVGIGESIARRQAIEEISKLPKTGPGPGSGDKPPRPFFFSDQSGIYPFSNVEADSPGPDPAPAPAPVPEPDPATLPPIEQACRATNFTQLCATTLTQSKRLPDKPTATQIIQTSIWLVTQDLKKAQGMIQDILNSQPQTINLTCAAQNCVEYFQNAEYRMKLAVDALPRGRIQDARTYLSAAHTYEYDVWSALKYVNTSVLVDQTMAFTWSLIQLSSNALSMLKTHDVFGDDMVHWEHPKSERNGLWETDFTAKNSEEFKADYKPDFGKDPPPTQNAGPKIGFSEMKPDVTVCKGGKCNYEMIQEAVDAGRPDGKRYVIAIKAGIYDEIVRVPLQKKNVVFLGDGIGKTIITGAKSANTPGVSTYNTGTVGVKGDGFMAANLTIQNTAGPNAQQAVAFVSDSDQTVMENCEFLGNQDTLYAHTHRQFYKSCRIVGNVDFIFGCSATVFQDCTILIGPRQVTPEKGETNCVAAHGRIDPAQTEGFVFHNCLINGTEYFMPFFFS